MILLGDFFHSRLRPSTSAKTCFAADVMPSFVDKPGCLMATWITGEFLFLDRSLSVNEGKQTSGERGQLVTPSLFLRSDSGFEESPHSTFEQNAVRELWLGAMDSVGWISTLTSEFQCRLD